MLVVAVFGWAAYQVYLAEPEPSGFRGIVQGGEVESVQPSGAQQTVPGIGLTEPAPTAVRKAADRYVKTVNVKNPQGIVKHWVDKYANLYVVFGAQVLTIEEDSLPSFIDMQGRSWRSYVHDALGQWEVGRGFAPGIVAVDTLTTATDSAGPWAHSLNGEVAIFRCPQYPKPEGFIPACDIHSSEMQRVPLAGRR